MLPPLPDRLVEAGRMLLSRYSGIFVQKKRKPTYRLQPKQFTKATPFRLPNLQDPFVSLRKGMMGLSTTITNLTKKNSGENYTTVLREFVPQNTKLLVPKFPSNSKDIHLEDIDGDSRNELITSYMHGEELRTIILKKENGRWNKTAQIDHPGYSEVNFRSFTDITGDGTKNMLLGLTRGDYADLHGYALDKGEVSRMLVKRYHKFEVIEPTQGNSPSTGAHIAIWNKKGGSKAAGRSASNGDSLDGSFEVDVVHWNGSDFASTTNSSPYYKKNVIPYYASKVKQSPNSPTNWYNLAEALIKGGANRDALTAIEIGMRQDKKSDFKENFLKLKENL